MGSQEPEKDLGSPQSLAAQLAELQNRPVGDRRLDRARARALAWTERTTSRTAIGPAAELVWVTGRRDATVGGSVLAAALAYRIFIWLLPLALALVLALSFVADISGTSSSKILADAGVTGYVASSVGTAAGQVHGWARLSGLAVALLILLYETYALLRAARAVTALAWRLPVRPVSSPARATALFLVWIAGFVAASSSAATIRARLDFPADVVVGLAVYLVLPVFWVVLSWWLLPHAAERWPELIPGAIVMGAAMAFIGLFTTLVLFPYLTHKQQTYGVLGVAAGLLFAFFLIGRSVEVSAALNAVLAERRRERRLAR
jgi:uncharacterized BrkB/YihY/UPF0761 family membrane protein